MVIIKRNGKESLFEKSKIRNAIRKANAEAEAENQLSEGQIYLIADEIEEIAEKRSRALNVEEIQDLVEDKIMNCGKYEVARKYIKYRYNRELNRRSNTTDEKILSLIECENEEAKQENANKNPTIASVQRDYMAGEVSKDLTKRILLPQEIVDAHEKGIIHFHDADYYSQHIHNCDLINLEDMLQNGTVISGTLIEKPHSFSTACNIATQIIAQVASSQYGGQSITLSHLAPFVDVSRQKIMRKTKKAFDEAKMTYTEEQLKAVVENKVKDEIEKGVQIIQYQVVTLMTTNGQAPFITVFMYLNEVENEQTKHDLAMIIEEVLKQRIQGVKNEKGVWITPAFPKLIYALEEDNIKEGSKYWYLTELAAKCTAKRMVPDYISEKKMLELKGDAYPCMGCVDGKEVIAYKFKNNVYTESFERMWNRLSNYYEVQFQKDKKDFLMRTPDVEIYDQKKGFVKNYGIIKNHNSDWLRITFSNGRVITCTKDHPFETTDGKIVYAKNLKKDDFISIDKKSALNSQYNYSVKTNRAWLFGFTLCDSTYYDTIIASISQKGENEISNMFINTLKDEYGLNVTKRERKRGAKGNYIDLIVNSDGTNSYRRLRLELACLFEGKAKNDRHIPNEVFSWSENSKLSFLAGMIDADGYLNTNMRKAKIQIGSTNKELAIQQMLLAQSCGMFATIYINHYKASQKEKVRYRVEFVPSKELLTFIKCKKKKELFDSILENSNKCIANTDVCCATKIEKFVEDSFSYDVTTESEHFTVSGIYSHNCRSFLTPDRFTDNGAGNIANAKNYKPNKHKYYGRFNQGVVTINLPDVALSAKGDMNEFWKILDERLELCHKALKCRHERLLGTPTSIAPILWQYGALARLSKDEKIDKLLFGGYSTISLGYAGLWECVYGLIKKKITEPEGKELGLKIMQTLNDYCNKWKADENIDYSLYGTPLESTTYKFAKCLQDRFGVVEGVSDKNYITNSYHIKVTEKVNAFEKLKFESEFQALSPGGAISYIEVPDMKDNIAAVLEVIKFIYDNIMYAELNTKSDYCQECGYDGEIQIVQEGNKLVWRCPNCGNEDQSKLNVARRTCGKQSSEIATIKNDRTSGKPRLYNNFEDYKAGNPEPSSQNNKNSKNSNYKVCDICGRHEKHIIGYYGKKLCNKHYNQIKKYGHVLENSPRTIYDKNEIRVEDEIAYIELYDKSYNVVALAMIDAEDVDKVKYSKWRLNCNGYVISTNKFDGKTTFLHRRILNNTNQFVDHINGNVLDNRKQNLRLATKSQNQMNVNYKGVSKTKNDKHYAHIKIKGKAINLGVYVDEEEALYARYFAEKLLFKEYRFPKEEPFVLTNRKNEIENYVRNRLEKYKDVITDDAENTKNAA